MKFVDEKCTYECEATTKSSSIKTIYVDKCPSNELYLLLYTGLIHIILKYWLKTLVAEEGSNVIFLNIGLHLL